MSFDWERMVAVILALSPDTKVRTIAAWRSLSFETNLQAQLLFDELAIKESGEFKMALPRSQSPIINEKDEVLIVHVQQNIFPTHSHISISSEKCDDC